MKQLVYARRASPGSQGSIVQPARHPRAPLPPDAVRGVVAKPSHIELGLGYNESRPKRQHKPTAPIAGPGALPRFM
ncbi:hypothetical protein GE21DRAFT_10563 [Neurospora crassa]|uniref:Uncharacterized protein n=1 Tax=Neurospora crassa (strain ATCC 24698 / 74-OR23-1A / CBS 708.71 / DSM 1257 / FGSC 987) TaxID=367110 RepID=Q7S499_NEUCR|nr:hypothetical protein NCU08149 [Neurospora crassa OR74A]EAA30324.2 hypothetical protein NCU08149 [Neurospora crassa OR74A]KHE79207.1 hypothetical protein GE21DRAFT_10563 [Neurospora crassa]|eukprot:XP_959560.2 hypothetical protein NCU08149 [Neurospora crassa OR74A]